MHLEFIVEEESAEAALIMLLPAIIPEPHTYDVIVIAGKKQLLRELPTRLQPYHYWPEPICVIVLVDRDEPPCEPLKEQLETIAREAGHATKSAPDANGFRVVNRIAVEELEAWFFGDVEALREAYPKIPESLASQAPYRDPDAIMGGTAERLAQLLYQHGYISNEYRLPKIEVAENVAQHMQPERNQSRSFQVFVEGIEAALAQ